MPKKVIIEASLVKEADDLPNTAIEKQIQNALEENNILPWIKNIKKISVQTT